MAGNDAKNRAAEALRELRDAAIRGDAVEDDTPLDLIDELLDWLEPSES